MSKKLSEEYCVAILEWLEKHAELAGVSSLICQLPEGARDAAMKIAERHVLRMYAANAVMDKTSDKDVKKTLQTLIAEVMKSLVSLKDRCCWGLRAGTAKSIGSLAMERVPPEELVNLINSEGRDFKETVFACFNPDFRSDSGLVETSLSRIASSLSSLKELPEDLQYLENGYNYSKSVFMSQAYIVRFPAFSTEDPIDFLRSSAKKNGNYCEVFVEAQMRKVLDSVSLEKVLMAQREKRLREDDDGGDVPEERASKKPTPGGL